MDPVAQVHALLTVCGLTAAARNAIINVEGFRYPNRFNILSGDKDITEMAKRMAARPSASRVNLGTVDIVYLQGLVYWIKDRVARGQEIDYTEFDEAVLEEAMQEKNAIKIMEDSKARDTDVGKAETDVGWHQWSIEFVNMLAGKLGAATTSLKYVVRKDVEDDYEFADDDEARLYEYPHYGQSFRQDNKTVYQLLKAKCLKTAAWDWIQEYDRTSNGRAAWLALCDHYNGEAEENKRVDMAHEQLKQLYYTNETTFPFEKFLTKLKAAFAVLDEVKDEKLSDKQKVHKMLDMIRSNDPALISAVTVTRKEYKTDFTGAANYFSSEVTRIYPAAQAQNSSRRRRISEVNTDQGGRDGRRVRGRFGGRSGFGGNRRNGFDRRRGGNRGGRGHGGRGGGNGGPAVLNGVDVTDVTRPFGDDEWEKLGAVGRSYVNSQRSRNGGRGGRGGNNRGRNGRGAGRGGDGGRGGRAIGAVESATNNTQQDDNGQRGAQNGNGFGRGAYQQQS